MVNKMYIKGKNFEYRVRNELDKEFYIVRQAKSAFPDLFGVRKITGKKICVECKYNKYLTQEEKLKLIEIWVKFEIHPFLAYSEKGKVKYFDILFNEQINSI